MASAPRTTTTRGSIDAGLMLASVRRALPALLAIAAVVGAFAFLLIDRVPPLYRAETRLTLGIGTANPDVLAQTLAGEVQLIRSREIAGEVIAALSLGDQPEYQDRDGAAASFHDILVRLGLARDVAALSPEERVLALYERNLSVEPGTRSAIVRIGFWSADPALAAKAANAVAGAYVALRQSAVDESADLQRRIASLREAIAENERRATELRSELAAMPVLDDGERASLLEERRSAIADAEEARADADAVRDAVEGGSLPLAVPAFADDPAVAALREEQATLRAELSREVSTRPLGNPRIAEIARRLAEIDAAMRAEAVRIVAGLESIAEQREARAAEVDGILADADSSGPAARELEALVDTIADDRAALDAALSRQAALTQGGTLPNTVRILSPASPPRVPGWPDVAGLTALAVALAFLVGAAVVVVRDVFTGRAYRTTPFAPLAYVDLPSPAVGRMRRTREGDMARAPSGKPTLAPEVDEESSLVEVAESIAGRRRILVTLAEDSDRDGRPLAAVELARALANRDRTVVLLDLHADGANETAMGEVPNLVGFSDLLAAEASFAQAIFRDRRSRAHFIPAGSRPVEPAALAGERLSTLLTATPTTM